MIAFGYIGIAVTTFLVLLDYYISEWKNDFGGLNETGALVCISISGLYAVAWPVGIPLAAFIEYTVNSDKTQGDNPDFE